jgi:hypothetical protein
MQQVSTTPQSLRRYRVSFAIAALALLAVPLIAMQYAASEVDWAPGDFLVFASMLAVLGGAIEGAIRFVPKGAVRKLTIGTALIGFVLVWAMLATG